MTISKMFTTIMATSILTLIDLNVNAQQDTQKSTPVDLVNALHSAFGEHKARAVHAKGIILEGTFVPSKEAAAITKAKHLQNQKSKVIVRFSDFTGLPDIPDNAGPANPRGFGIKFIMPDGSTTDIVGHSFNGFPTENSDQFRDLLLAIASSGASATKPTALDSFLLSHPVAKTFLTTQKFPASYATVGYFGVNAFKFTNNKGVAHFIRYQFIPEQEKLLTSAQYEKKDANYLVKEIKKHVATKRVVFRMYAQLAEEGDAIEDPSIAWPDTRKKVFLGTITITKLANNSIDADKKLFFIPNNIPDGIEPADPMINFRSQAYPVSVKERQ